MSEHDMSEDARQALDDKAHRWVVWCLTRRIFAPYVKSNVLARLQPTRRSVTDGPDSFLDPEMPFLNMAIHALCEQGDCAHEAECFLGIYWYNANIKALAREQACARGTIYNRARRFMARAESLSNSIRRVNESFMPEQCSKFVEQNSSTAD